MNVLLEYYNKLVLSSCMTVLLESIYPIYYHYAGIIFQSIVLAYLGQAYFVHIDKQ